MIPLKLNKPKKVIIGSIMKGSRIKADATKVVLPINKSKELDGRTAVRASYPFRSIAPGTVEVDYFSDADRKKASK